MKLVHIRDLLILSIRSIREECVQPHLTNPFSFSPGGKKPSPERQA